MPGMNKRRERLIGLGLERELAVGNTFSRVEGYSQVFMGETG